WPSCSWHSAKSSRSAPSPPHFSGMTSAVYPAAFILSTFSTGNELARSCSPARVAKSAASSAASGTSLFCRSDISWIPGGKSHRQNSVMKAGRGETGLLAGGSVRGSAGCWTGNAAGRSAGRLRHHEALRIRHDRREQIDLRVERFAQTAQQTHHAPDQQDVGGNFDDRIGANRARQLLGELLDHVLVRVSLLRLD